MTTCLRVTRSWLPGWSRLSRGSRSPVEAVVVELVKATVVGRVGQACAEVVTGTVGSGSGTAERPGWCHPGAGGGSGRGDTPAAGVRGVRDQPGRGYRDRDDLAAGDRPAGAETTGDRASAGHPRVRVRASHHRERTAGGVRAGGLRATAGRDRGVPAARAVPVRVAHGGGAQGLERR